jgi:CBS domain-containing protein
MKVEDVMTSDVKSCRPDINLAAVGARLPVVNDSGMLQGILCMNDIVLRAEEAEGKREPELSYEDAMSTFKAICEHRPLKAAAKA